MRGRLHDRLSRAWRRATIRTLAATGVAVLFLLPAASPASRAAGRDPAGQPEQPARLRPLLGCVTANPDGTVTATFGYVNDSDVVLSIPPGEGNSIDPDSYLDRLPSQFAPGRTDQAFTVTFPGPDVVVWTLAGKTSTASAASAPCRAEPPGPPTTTDARAGGNPPAGVAATSVPSPAPSPASTSVPAPTVAAPAATASNTAPAWSPAPATRPRTSGVRGTSVSAAAPTRPAGGPTRSGGPGGAALPDRVGIPTPLGECSRSATGPRLLLALLSSQRFHAPRPAGPW
jgi:hypothetical protein